jgi:hypothetical protein
MQLPTKTPTYETIYIQVKPDRHLLLGTSVHAEEISEVSYWLTPYYDARITPVIGRDLLEIK